jgi:hypothetical protein
MSFTPNIVMICIDIQGEEHHCQEEQGILGEIPSKQNNQPIEMRILLPWQLGRARRNVPDFTENVCMDFVQPILALVELLRTL